MRLLAERRHGERLATGRPALLLWWLEMVMDMDIQSLLALILRIGTNSHLKVSWLEWIELLLRKL